MNPSPTPPPGRTPNGGSAATIRRRRPVDPLVRPKKPQRPAAPTSTGPQVNGVSKPVVVKTTSTGPATVPTTASEPFEDIPLLTTKRALSEGLRHHVMRFYVASANRTIDPRDEAEFTRPVHLHRRDPRINPLGHWKEGGSEAMDVDMNGAMDEKERERLEILKAERRAEREANQAQIAPVGKNTPSKKREMFQKKTEQIYQVTNSEERKKQQALKYEETLPWHLEDFGNKNTWAGTYEAALSDSHVMLIPETQGEDKKIKSYRLVPLEKWYKFSAKNRFEALTIEQAEEKMSKKFKDPRWFMETQKAMEQKSKEESGTSSRLFTRKGERGESKKTVKSEDADEDRPEIAADGDDIDYNYDEAFADDEENPLFGGDDEENKEAEEKIKREQREANIFQLKEEKDYDKEEDEEKEKAKAEKKKAKRIQRALMKRERNYIYEDDSDGNPYSSESESEDSETERLKEEEAKKEEGQKSSQDKTKLAPNDKMQSGASSRGTNTPSGRPKTSDLARKSILKRPGSPNLSDASGNESSRKKHKKAHPPSSQPSESGAGAGQSISRPSSPSGNHTRRSSVVKLNVDALKLNLIASKQPQPAGRAGSGSEAEGSGAEMSDGSGRKLKLKLKSGLKRIDSKNGSRATSPAAASPGKNRKPNKPASSKSDAIPMSIDELAALIPPEGVLMHTLIQNERVRQTPELSTKLKTISKLDRETKRLMPRAVRLTKE